MRLRHFIHGSMTAVVLLGVVVMAGAKQREWKTGKLVSEDQKDWVSYGGSTTTGQIAPSGQVNMKTSQSKWSHSTYTIAIDDGEYVYFCSRTLNFRWQRDPQFTENADVKFAIEKKDVYIVDDTGHEFKMELAKRRKKDNPEPSKP